jgi:hypothetical protein
VNYDKFAVDRDIEDDYFELVRYVQETYYSSIRRYTADAFERLKLAQELEKHNVDPETVDPI